MDHRRGRRESARLPVVLHNRHTPPIEAQIVSLSAGGAFIRLPGMARPLGGILRLEFSLPQESGEPREWSALIVRDNAEGIGVMFDRRHDRAFAQYVASNHPSPRPLPARRRVRPAARGEGLQLAVAVSARRHGS